MAMDSAYEQPKATAGIKALPPTTVRQLGSSQVLVDPNSVVKELIDNALDARATAIFVDIASDTLSSIQVKDNGHGIPAEDRALVCRRYCTSKIRDFHDLRGIGGSWLGFRGEAMASMVEMSGAVDIITRVEGEPVAVLLKYGRNGELESTERASHPVGTTVKVSDLFKLLPVRKQEALKHSAKWLAKTRRTMQAYALARPTVRFQLRVLKAKTDKGNFTYAPKASANIEDATFKVVGRDCASQCEWTAMESDGFEVHAFLPKPDAVGARIANEGAFLSVDSRPVNSTHGTMKKITTVVRERLRKANPTLESIKDPFLCMNIKCPPDSYDPNIEPAKDNVLFSDEGLVVSVVEKLAKSFYPEAVASPKSEHEDPTPTQTLQDIPSSSPFGICMDATQSQAENISVPRNKGRQWRSNMYGIDEEDLELLSENQPPAFEDEDEENGRRAVDVSNPWIIAKMNAATKHKNSTGLMTPAKSSGDFVMKSSSSPLPKDVLNGIPTPQVLTPKTMSQVNVSQSSMDEELVRGIQPLSSPHARGSKSRFHDAHDEEARRLQARQQFSEPPPDIDGRSPFSQAPYGLQSGPQPARATANRFTSSFQPINAPGSELAETHAAPRQGRRKPTAFKNKPSKPPFKEQEDLWFGQPMRGTPAPDNPGRRRKPARNAPPLFPTEVRRNGGLDDSLSSSTHFDERLASENNTDIRSFFNGKPKTRQRSASFEMSAMPSFTPINPRARASKDQSTHDEPVPDIAEQLQAYAERERPRSAPHHGQQLPYHNNPQLEPEHASSPTPGPSFRPLRRRTTDTMHRTHSCIQNLILPLSFTTPQLRAHMRKLDMKRNTPEWGYPAEDAYEEFAAPVTDAQIAAWAVVVANLLDESFERKEGVDIEGRIEAAIKRVLRAQCQDDVDVEESDGVGLDGKREGTEDVEQKSTQEGMKDVERTKCEDDDDEMLPV